MRVMERLDWGGVGSGVRWLVLEFLGQFGTKVFVVDFWGCRVFGGELRIGWRRWLCGECRGEV